MEWTAQRKSQDKGESEEASAGIESDGRQKEIADETIVGQWEKPQGRNHRLMRVEIDKQSGLGCMVGAFFVFVEKY